MFQALPFLHPTLAGLALLAGLIPFIIHMINRRRFVRVPWAAMSFLLAAYQRSARRLRVEQFLLLLIRMGVIMLLGLALARPFVPASSLIGLHSSPLHRVILLDNSLSMKARTAQGKTRFKLAKRFVRQLVDSFPPTDAVSLVTLAKPAEALLARAATDRRVVRDRLDHIEATQRSGDAAGGLTRALEILHASPFPPANRMVYLVSDLPRHVWQGEAGRPSAAVTALRQLADELNKSTVDLNVVRVAPGGHDNISVSRLTTESSLLGVDHPVRIIVEVTNHSTSSVDDLSLEVRGDSRIIGQDHLGPLAAGASTRALLTTQFAEQGTHLIEARVSRAFHPVANDSSEEHAVNEANVLEDDDVRFLSIEVQDGVPVLLVDGRPGATRLGGAAGFLETALAPNPSVLSRRSVTFPDDRSVEKQLFKSKVITEPELPSETLRDYKVIVLCGVPHMSKATWRQLEVFVSSGGGLMVFGSRLVDVDNYNRLGYADGLGLLPGKILGPKLLSSAASDTPSTVDPAHRAQEPSVHFRLTDPVHSIAGVFINHPESGLFSARVNGYLRVTLDRDESTSKQPSPKQHQAQVVLQYSNGDIALVASRLGHGRVLLSTTSANMEWNNLPAKGDYVSLMVSAMAFLAPKAGRERNISVGQALQQRLQPSQVSLPLSVRLRDGRAVEPDLIPQVFRNSNEDSLALSYGPIEEAGPLTVSIGSQVRQFAANVDPQESDLTPIDARSFEESLNRPVHLLWDPAIHTESRNTPVVARSTELTLPVLYLAMALLMVEMWLAMSLGPRRADAGIGSSKIKSERLERV